MNDSFSPEKQPGYAASNLRGGTWAAAGLLVFILAGLVSNGYGLLSREQPVLPPDTTLDQILDGSANREIAASLATLPMPKAAAELQRGIGWVVAHDLGDQVRQGCPGWLFLTEELEVRPGGAAAAQARVDTVQRVHEKLQNQGIELIVAVVPDKSRIESSHLCQLQRPTALQGRASEWVAALQAKGVTALDLNQSLNGHNQPVFLQTDTHWNETGAHFAARQISQQVHAQGMQLEPRQRTAIIRDASRLRAGDLTRLAGIDWLPETWQPAMESVQPSRFEPIAEPAEAGSNSSVTSSDDDLFGDADLPTVALLGSSFSRTSEFANFLAHELETTVPSFAKDGGGFSVSAGEYLESPAFKQTPPRLIIWEIPERVLDMPLAGDKPIWP